MANEMITIGVQNNAVAKAVVNDLFKDIDFTGISTAIENIGNVNGSLTAEEKEMANSIVDQWQNDVMARLRNRGHEMSDFVDFFEVGSNGHVRGADKLDEIGEDLATQTKTVKEFQHLQDLLDELMDLFETRPEEPSNQLNINKTQKEILEEENQYKLDYAKYNLAVKKKQREIYLAEKAWKKLLKQNKEVAELIKKAKKFNKEMSNFTNMCHDKAQIAKLNITVSNVDVRKSLRELLNFSATV
jgi:hypothetical protein